MRSQPKSTAAPRPPSGFWGLYSTVILPKAKLTDSVGPSSVVVLSATDVSASDVEDLRSTAGEMVRRLYQLGSLERLDRA